MYVRLSHDILLLLLICFKYMVHCVMSLLYNYVEQVHVFENRIGFRARAKGTRYFFLFTLHVQCSTVHWILMVRPHLGLDMLETLHSVLTHCPSIELTDRV